MSKIGQDGPFSILRRTAGALDYDEGDGRRIAFEYPAAIEPHQVSVPSAREWSRRTPDWAHARRDLIIDRLRRWGAIVAEVDDEATRIVSPDGTFVVAWVLEVYNRGWRETRISTLPELGAVVALPNVLPSGQVHFPRPGAVRMQVAVPSGARFDLLIDVSAREFRFGSDARSEPLAGLPGRLGLDPPPASPPVVRRPSMFRPASPFRDIATMFICLIFVVGGIWMSLTAATTEDRLAGGFGALLFAVAAWVHVRGRYSPRRKVPGRRGAAAASNPIGPESIGPGGERGPRCGAYFPLMAAVAELPWGLLMVMGLLFAVGDTRFEFDRRHAQSLARHRGDSAVRRIGGGSGRPARRLDPPSGAMVLLCPRRRGVREHSVQRSRRGIGLRLTLRLTGHRVRPC